MSSEPAGHWMALHNQRTGRYFVAFAEPLREGIRHMTVLLDTVFDDADIAEATRVLLQTEYEAMRSPDMPDFSGRRVQQLTLRATPRGAPEG
jgi:hypothetical protein